MKNEQLLYIDQYGYKYMASTVKELCKQVGGTKASKMYIDTKEGETKHIEYIIKSHWLRAYSPVYK